jgi:hypothetical protein
MTAVQSSEMCEDLKASHQEAMEEVRRVVREAKELSQAADGALTDNLAAWVAGRYAVATRQLGVDKGSGVPDWNLLRALCHDLVDLRRGDHSVEWVRIERERLEMERSKHEANFETSFWQWANEHREDVCEKVCNTPKMTAEEKQRRICEILGTDYNESRQRRERNEARDDDAAEDFDQEYSI